MNQRMFKEELNERVVYIESVIKRYLPKEEGYQKTVNEAMNYSILAGGKRLRPLLMLETYKLFGGTDKVCVEPFMAAIEMIHTYSLVHDDLPAMDNDEYRRGRKTTHIVFGEAIGILAGDGLLNYAFETAHKAFHEIEEGELASTTQQLNRMKRAAKALEILAQKAGIFGMIGGQVIDIEGITYSATDKIDRSIEKNQELQSKLNYMYKLKTGALIEASMMIGAVLAGAKDDEIPIVEQMATDLGLAFQIQDDILDVTSTREVLGKPTHSDERNNKVTYVSLLGLEDAKKEVTLQSKRVLGGFDILNKSNEFLEELIITLITREN